MTVTTAEIQKATAKPEPWHTPSDALALFKKLGAPPPEQVPAGQNQDPPTDQPKTTQKPQPSEPDGEIKTTTTTTTQTTTNTKTKPSTPQPPVPTTTPGSARQTEG